MSVYGATVARLGEVLDFGVYGKIKASLKASTRAVFNLANRAYYVEGQCFRSEPDMFDVGDYFTRECDGKVYFVSTIQPEPLAPDLVYLFGMQCNAAITISRCTGCTKNEKGDRIRLWETVAENVYAYRDFLDRSSKQTNDGLIGQAIYNLIVPQKYVISAGNRVTMKFNCENEYKDVNFNVESVGTALADFDGISGITTVQMSLDLRNN